MTEEAKKLVQQLTAVRFEYLPKVETLAQRTGALGIVNLFALASHTLTAMTGTLAVVSTARLGANGDWHSSSLGRQVQRLAELGVQVSASVERLVGMALVDLQAIHTTSHDAMERENIQDILTNGQVYMESLSTVAVETADIARRQGVWGRRRPYVPPSQTSAQPCTELDQARESVRTLIAQIIELELGVEQFGGRWTMT
ncbi:MAG: hypothetical protein Q8N13_19100 [Acidovorax sp.]|nr:hypothetical protein [Acidovorax sp.]